MLDEVANRLDETKAEKFVRLAEKRVTKALQELRKVGNLAAPAYEYTDKQVKAILTTLSSAIGDIDVRFHHPCSAEDESFSFEDWMTDEGEPEDDDGIETVVHDDKNP